MNAPPATLPAFSALGEALIDAAKIDIPFPIRTVLLPSAEKDER